MRTHIAQSLQRRAKAIRKAVARYNTAARALEPPRPTLDWTKVSHYSFIDQFNILADTRHSVMDKAWAGTAIRELMFQSHRIARAHEEILRLNIELRRLHTSIVDEERDFDTVLQRLLDKSSPLHPPTLEFITRRKGVNKLLLARMQSTYSLEGFTGTPSPGVRKMRPGDAPSSITPPPPHRPPTPQHVRVPVENPVESDNEGADEDEDEYVDTLATVVDFISQLDVSL